LAGAALAVLAVAALAIWIDHRDLADRLLRQQPQVIQANAELLHRAITMGRPLYSKHCAGCHGGELEGSAARGVPDLARNAWLYGNDVVDVERTILYGIRSGHPKARNVTDMPALVRTGQITQGDAHDVVEYLQKLAGASFDQSMAERGRKIYYDKGNCYDCHADDARGVIDYGTPPLTGPVWLYGGDRATLYRSILDGRHGICPAWVDTLEPVQIRALALYLVAAGADRRLQTGNSRVGSG
jgi:cytochrome c oxidase cbb3-type subunit 3